MKPEDLAKLREENRRAAARARIEAERARLRREANQAAERLRAQRKKPDA